MGGGGIGGEPGHKVSSLECKTVKQISCG